MAPAASARRHATIRWWKTHRPQPEQRAGRIAQTLVKARVVDDDGNDKPVGETGEIVARGDVVMAGYWRNPEACAKALRAGN